MAKNINPFTILTLDDFYWQDATHIEQACDLADSIQNDLKDIRAGGNEVEIAVRSFFKKKLKHKYHVTNGHIIDANLRVSPQLDIIIADDIKTPVLDTLADQTDLVFYESVYAYGEVKKSFYSKDLLNMFSNNMQRIKKQLKREDVPANTIECSIDNIQVKNNMTTADKRNILFSFMFFARHEGVDLKQLGEELNQTPNEYLPNMLVFMDYAVIVNIKRDLWESKNELNINLYPELADNGDNMWVAIPWHEKSKVLGFAYLLLVEHLNCSIVSKPEIRNYSSKMFPIDRYSITSL